MEFSIFYRLDFKTAAFSTFCLVLRQRRSQDAVRHPRTWPADRHRTPSEYAETCAHFWTLGLKRWLWVQSLEGRQICHLRKH